MTNTIAKQKTKIWFVICVVLSMATSTYLMLQVNPLRESLSMAGAANHWMFVMWGVTTAAAIFIGTKAVLTKHEIKNKAIEVAIVLVCLLGLLATMVVGDGGGGEHNTATGSSILYNPWDWWFHLISAVTFMVMATTLMFIVLIARYRKTRHWINLAYIVALSIATVGLAVHSAMQSWVVAFSQVVLVNIAMLILLSMSCLENLHRTKVADDS